jgi:hypothetical protein
MVQMVTFIVLVIVAEQELFSAMTGHGARFKLALPNNALITGKLVKAVVVRPLA